MQLVVPEKEDQTYIHAKYMNELVKGILLPETHAGLLEIIDKLRVEQDMDAVILAGTELPLILRESSHHGLPLLDTTQIHVCAAVSQLS
jgi:aspartate racemase